MKWDRTLKYQIEDHEWGVWTSLLADFPKMAKPELRRHGFDRVSDIPPERRASVAAGISWSLSNPDSRFGPKR